jgi:hypothetical protein
MQFKDAESPAGIKVLGASTTENVPTLPTPQNIQGVTLDSSTLNPAQLKVVNDFIALLKSKV